MISVATFSITGGEFDGTRYETQSSVRFAMTMVRRYMRSSSGVMARASRKIGRRIFAELSRSCGKRCSSTWKRTINADGARLAFDMLV